ncbi:unnamed protein product [Echinostoma caproni]|uniref:SWIM-type domain-containing protein n=1 Tax=Echinostoma caproni TaxID=27848 RepID=A0A183ABM1_9TREM|nr:unnamed protein product [Echinostoma caproni]
MYMQVSSPSTDSTIRLQLNFQSPNYAESKTVECSGGPRSQRIFKSRVQELLNICDTASPFLLVGQPAPNAFVLVSKRSNEGSEPLSSTNGSVQSRPRFHVIIGPQLCSCMDPGAGGANEPTPCVHILFVLFRVLHAPLDDPSLALTPLPTSKAESLIQAHLKRKQRDFLQSTKGQKCYLSQVSITELKTTSPRDLGCSQIRPSSPDTRLIPLAMPKPIHPSRIPPVSLSSADSHPNQTPQLLAAMHATRQNSPDCCELSKLTTGIQPSPRHEAASADPITIASGTTTTTCASRTSSTESTDSPARPTRMYRSARSVKHHSDLAKSGQQASMSSLTRRPRTVPQPDLPPRNSSQNGTRVIRHACSTTFRPIRDHSPEHKLTPIRSEETSAENSLKHDLFWHKREQSCDNSPNPGHHQIGPKRASSFRHWNSGPFKPISDKTDSTGVSFSPPASPTLVPVADSLQAQVACVTTFCHDVPDQQERLCALCLHSLSVDANSDEALFQCRTTDSAQQCVATFHRSCCQIWLEEIELDGDSAHCPVCLCRWETLPLDCPLQLVNEPARPGCPCSEVGSSSGMGHLNSDSHVTSDPISSCCDSGFESREAPMLLESRTCAPSGPNATAARGTLTQSPFPDYKLCVSAFSLEVGVCECAGFIF